MRAAPGLGAMGAALHNHWTSNIGADTAERVAAIPKAPDGLGALGHARPVGACGVAEHPFRPARAGCW